MFSLPRAQVRSLVREPRSHKLHGVANKQTNKQTNKKRIPLMDSYFLKDEGQILNFPNGSQLTFLKSLVINILMSKHQCHLSTVSPKLIAFPLTSLRELLLIPLLSPSLLIFLFSRQLITLSSVSLTIMCLSLLWCILHSIVCLPFPLLNLEGNDQVLLKLVKAWNSMLVLD